MAKGESTDMSKTEAFKVTAQNYRTITDGDIAGAFTIIAHDHDSVAAANLIKYFHFAMEDGAIFESHTKFSQKELTFLDFIKRAFGRYMEGKSLDAAFGLTRGRGERNVDDTTLRDLKITAFVILKMRKKTTWARSIAQAASEFKTGNRACEDAYATYKVALQNLDEKTLADIVRSNDRDLSV